MIEHQVQCRPYLTNLTVISGISRGDTKSQSDFTAIQGLFGHGRGGFTNPIQGFQGKPDQSGTNGCPERNYERDHHNDDEIQSRQRNSDVAQRKADNNL